VIIQIPTTFFNELCYYGCTAGTRFLISIWTYSAEIVWLEHPKIALAIGLLQSALYLPSYVLFRWFWWMLPWQSSPVTPVPCAQLALAQRAWRCSHVASLPWTLRTNRWRSEEPRALN